MFKVILCGETEVGKTTILNRLASRREGTPTTPTMGASFASVQVMWEDNKINLNIWDTAGQEKYRSLIKIYFRAADLAVFVVDLTRKKTVDEIPAWVHQAETNAGKRAPAGIIVANKMDCENMELVSDAEISAVAKQHGFKWIKVSARTGVNFEELRSLLAEECLRHNAVAETQRKFTLLRDEQHYQKQQQEQRNETGEEEHAEVQLNEPDPPAPQKSGCC